MLHNLGRRGGLRRAGAIVAGMLLLASAMVATSSAAVGTVTISNNQSPNPVLPTGSATYTISITHDNTSDGNYTWFRVTDVSFQGGGSGTISASLTPQQCVQIAHNTTANNLTLTVTTAGTPVGTYTFRVRVRDYANSTDCTNDDNRNSWTRSNYVDLVVAKNSPTIATTLSGSNVAIGTAVHDSATLPGATAAAGGTVTYTVYTNNTCTTGAQTAGTKTVTNHLVPDSDAITFN
ncbi:MAG: hypothetical protein ACXWNI_07585, partial [Candidatus Limnocylindrales bacterium]